MSNNNNNNDDNNTTHNRSTTTATATTTTTTAVASSNVGNNNNNDNNKNNKNVDNNNSQAAVDNNNNNSVVVVDNKNIDNNILNINIGILGHVDSGKTSLVKALSTILSTASLDKSKQSKQRGMTLDLGFSCFFLHDVPQHIRTCYPTISNIQLTLVDCPGHASLIKTIIGGSQIIDMIILVIDVMKGWQTQTTECLVLAELTSPYLIVVLNKIDMISSNSDRTKHIQHVTQTIRERLITSTTRFHNAPIIAVSASVGGEKVAAILSSSDHNNKSSSSNDKHQKQQQQQQQQKHQHPKQQDLRLVKNETYNISDLVQLLQEKLPIPDRQHKNHNNNNNNNNNDSIHSVVVGTTSKLPKTKKKYPFYFSIDHCFPIRGRGTVLTGTVLSGSASVNDVLDFPILGNTERKIKSIQMFKRTVSTIHQGDRAGICITNLDSKLIERNIASIPSNIIHSYKGAICLVRKIKYYNSTLPLRNFCKFHISVGHTTIMATNVIFFGAYELSSSTISTANAKTTTETETTTTETTNINEEDTTTTDHNNTDKNKTTTTTTLIKKNSASHSSSATGSSSSSGKKSSSSKDDTAMMLTSSSLGGDAGSIANLPIIPFNFDHDYIQQDGLIEHIRGGVDDNKNEQNNNNNKKKKRRIDDNNNNSNNNNSQQQQQIKQEEEEPILQWAMLDFQTPVFCPHHSLIIGSRLDTVETNHNHNNSTTSTTNNNNNATILDGSSSKNTTDQSESSSCRLAFSGRIIERIDPVIDMKRLRIYTSKERIGIVSKLGDPYIRNDDNKIVRYEIFGSDLFKAETNMKLFIGMKIQTTIEETTTTSTNNIRPNNNNNNKSKMNNNNNKDKNQSSSTTHDDRINDNNYNNSKNIIEIGEIKSSFGTTGKFRIYFPGGTTAKEGDTLVMKFRRYANDPNKRMHQHHIILPKERPGTRIEVENTKSNKKKNKKSGTSTSTSGGGSSSSSNNNNNNNKNINNKKGGNSNNNNNKSQLEKGINRIGEVISVKGDVVLNNNNNNSGVDEQEEQVDNDEPKKRYSMAIINGFFTPDINIREKIDSGIIQGKVRIPSTGDMGIIMGPFGKAGKCKVSFVEHDEHEQQQQSTASKQQQQQQQLQGIPQSAVGAKAELL